MKAYSIKEVHEMTGVPAGTIRQWEKDLEGVFIVPRDEKGSRYYTDFDNEITSRKIVIPSSYELEKVFNTIDKVRVLYGQSSEQDNKRENFAHYKIEFVYYSKGLSNDELKKALSSKGVTVSWVTKEGKSITKKFNIGNIIKFNNEP